MTNKLKFGILALALAAGIVACSTTGCSKSTLVTNPIFGTNGVGTTTIELGISVGVADLLTSAINRSPSHAAEIRADCQIILDTLNGFVGKAGYTVADVTAALKGAKITSPIIIAMIPGITSLLNLADSELATLVPSTTPYVGNFVACLESGIQAAMAATTSTPQVK